MKFTKRFFVSLICIISIFASSINVYASTGVEKLFYNESISYNTNKAQHLADFSAQWLGDDKIVVFFKLLDSYGRTTVNSGTAEINIMNDYVDVYKSGKIKITDDWFYVYGDYCLGGVVIRDPGIIKGSNSYCEAYMTYTLPDGTIISSNLGYNTTANNKTNDVQNYNKEKHIYYTECEGVTDFGYLYNVDGEKESKTDTSGNKYMMYTYQYSNMTSDETIDKYSKALYDYGFELYGTAGQNDTIVYKYVNKDIGINIGLSSSKISNYTYTIITVMKSTAFLNNNTGSSSSSINYADNPNVPDFEYVTGAKFLGMQDYPDGSYIYIYDALSCDTSKLYLYFNELEKSGFTLFSNKSSKIYRKGDTFVSVKIDFERFTYQVFIIYMDLNI